MRRRWILVASLLGAAPAWAGKHRVERGETLEAVAQSYGCTTEAVLKANRLDTTLVPAGTLVTIPRCSLKQRARSREQIRGAKAQTADERARVALAVIDGATIVADSGERDDELEVSPTAKPRRSRLRDAERLPAGEGYQIRRPTRAFGEPHVVEHLRGALAAVRALYPAVHTLAIGDLSAEHGGKLDNHRSHQTGLDVDVGFYFTRVPEGYPDHFVAANAELDLAATWALVTAFARTAHLADGVEVIFLDRDVQARLYQWAKSRGTPADQLAALLQYPGSDGGALVRHWPHHADHLHVRFKSAE